MRPADCAAVAWPRPGRSLRNTMRTTARARHERFFRHPGRGAATGAALLVLVVVVALLIPAGPLAIDRSWSDAMQDLRTAVLSDVALAFNWLGRGLGRALALAAVGFLLLLARRRRALVAFAFVETFTPLLSSLLKALVDRPRPPDGALHPAGSSFPSGHAAFAGATSVALVLLFTVPGRRRRWWWTLAGLATAGMAWSRTYLQLHWLSDAVAGSLLGIAVSLLVFASAQRTGRPSDHPLRGCADAHAPAEGEDVRMPWNEDLADEVVEQLDSDPSIDNSAIAVSADDGEITLRGTVGSEREKEAASNIAASTFGVVAVNNQLLVR